MRHPSQTVVVFAAAAVLAGCSSGGPEPAPTSEAPPEHGSYAHCLAEHGVQAPPGPVTGTPAGVDPQAWQQAMEACSTLAPGPGQPPG
ncbi:hypothetical protein ACWDTP_29330 [Mycobacterium sp. NPDC003449]